METKTKMNATRTMLAGALALASLAAVPGFHATETASAGNCYVDVDGVIAVRVTACNSVRCADPVLVHAEAGSGKAHVDC